MEVTDEMDEMFFVDPLPPDLRCPVCLYVLNDPCQISCGHRFCKRCTESMKERNNGVLSCPVDRQTIQGEIFPDMAAKRYINGLKVKCVHFQKGCTWVGDLIDRKTHLKTCNYETHTCPQCEEILKNVFELDSHREVCRRRPVDCKYCKSSFPLSDMQSHFATCNQFPIQCPNECSSQMFTRSTINDHLQNHCPLKLLPCPLEPFGCKEKICRQDKEAHLEKCAVKHVTTLAERVLIQDQAIKQLQDNFKQCQVSLNDMNVTCYSSHGQFTWKVTDIRDKIRHAVQNMSNSAAASSLSQQDSFLYSPPFFTGEGGYKLCLCIHPAGDNNQGCLSLYFVIMKGPYDEILQWPFQKHVRLILINCRGGQSIVKEINPDPRLHYFRRPKEEKNVGYGYPRFIPLDKILSKDSEFVSTNSIFIRVNVYQ